MAGGTFITQNKVRPGAYTNMLAKRKSTLSVSERGTVAFPISLNWGAENAITKVTIDDLLNGNSIGLIGTDANDEDSLALQLAFLGANTLLLYRVNAGGDKATATIGDLTAEAKYSGVAGNKITVSVATNGDNFDVITSFDGKVKDKQTVSGIAELRNNDFVEFEGTGVLEANAGVTLTGGTNGTVAENAYTDFLSALDGLNFNCLAMPSEVEADKTATITKVRLLREDNGKYVQAVIIDTQANYEGIISIKQSFKMGETVVSKSNVAIYVAAITAGAPVNVSNTYKEVEGATEIVDVLSNDEIIEALNQGYFVFSTRQDGVIVVEQDINTLHSFDETRGYAFKKNRVIRTLDELAKAINLDFEKNYIGKVTNDSEGRNVFKASVMSKIATFVSMGCIEAVPAEDVEVLPGEDIDSLVLNLAITPLDSMEKLYTTITVK